MGGRVTDVRTPQEHARLCYIEQPWAFFTTAPLDKQWGDDWDDAPYEHNAGTPYEWKPYMAEGGIEQYEIVKVAWRGGGDLETPADLALPNSHYSVERINRGEIAWLTDPGYGTRPRVFTPVVWAGATVAEFAAIIEGRGGSIFYESAATLVARAELADTLAKALRTLADAEWMVTADWCDPGTRETVLAQANEALAAAAAAPKETE